ncbi:uncharacterized protein BO80DRAFT_23954 [Aspergillus ibericus CBS 121593]|uniref:Uncharacterized protein n=1 Tax=Aspergillus ibericus CBS 121593 TaxID=1448316 RepID=A0A395H611_9EURO|nr:hypothetical protein BO80DRAFT_23954 [Aspergillus ibericus CBS 121593]RAL03053.1 hypothetical protein BO80DRAFT_23954 [Aspergillus ibericus CBS 121593]
MTHSKNPTQKRPSVQTRGPIAVSQLKQTRVVRGMPDHPTMSPTNGPHPVRPRAARKQNGLARPRDRSVGSDLSATASGPCRLAWRCADRDAGAVGADTCSARHFWRTAGPGWLALDTVVPTHGVVLLGGGWVAVWQSEKFRM